MTLANSAQPPLSSAVPKNHGAANLNPAGIGFWALLREDFRTHDRKLLEQGFIAIAVHRFGNWRMGIKPKILRAPFSILYKMLYRWTEFTCGISLPYTVKVGRRVRLWHHSGMILHAKSIGDDVHIRHNTTFGVAKKEKLFELPTIEDRCDIGVGAVIIGNVTVGHDSVVGANAVVVRDVPPNSLAVGVPARCIARAIVEAKA